MEGRGSSPALRSFQDLGRGHAQLNIPMARWKIVVCTMPRKKFTETNAAVNVISNIAFRERLRPLKGFTHSLYLFKLRLTMCKESGPKACILDATGFLAGHAGLRARAGSKIALARFVTRYTDPELFTGHGSANYVWKGSCRKHGGEYSLLFRSHEDDRHAQKVSCA